MIARLLQWFGGLAVWMLVTLAAFAHEPVQAFLDALRDRGYYDVALDYLASAEKNPSLPDAFKETIPASKSRLMLTLNDSTTPRSFAPLL